MYQSWPPVQRVVVHLPNAAPQACDDGDAQGDDQASGTSEWDKYLFRPDSVDDLEFGGEHPTLIQFYEKMRVTTEAPVYVHDAYGRPRQSGSRGSLLSVIQTRPDLWPMKRPGRDTYIHYCVHADRIYYYHARDTPDVVVRLQSARCARRIHFVIRLR